MSYKICRKYVFNNITYFFGFHSINNIISSTLCDDNVLKYWYLYNLVKNCQLNQGNFYTYGVQYQ